MIRILNSQKVSLQVFLLVIGLLPFASLFVIQNTDIVFVHNAQGWFYSLYRSTLSTAPWILVVLSYILLFLFSTYLFWFNYSFDIVGQRTVLVSYLYFFLVSIPMLVGYLHPGFLSGLILFFGLIQLFSIYGKSRYNKNIFNSGLIFTLAILIYPPYLLVLPIYVLAIARMKEPSFRDIIILLTGVLSMVWLYFAILWLNGNLSYEWQSIIQWFEIRTTWPIQINGQVHLIIAWIIWMVLLLPMILVASRARKDAGRRVISILVQFIWFGPALILVFERVSFEVWPLIAIPYAILLSLALQKARFKWMSALIFLSVFIFLVLFQVFLFL